MTCSRAIVVLLAASLVLFAPASAAGSGAAEHVAGASLRGVAAPGTATFAAQRAAPAPVQPPAGAPVASSTPFSTQRWGQALARIGELVGVSAADDSVRLVSPNGGLGFSQEWPATPAATKFALDRDIPWQHGQYVGLLGSTSSWYGTFLGVCTPPRDFSGPFLNATLDYLAAEHANKKNGTQFDWSTSMSRSQWETAFAGGALSAAVNLEQTGFIVNSSGAVQFHFHDVITATSITLVNAVPAGSWFHPDVLARMANVKCPRFGSHSTAQSTFFSPQTGFLNSLTSGFVVMTNITIQSDFTFPNGGGEQSHSASTQPTAPFVAAYVQQRLPLA